MSRMPLVGTALMLVLGTGCTSGQDRGNDGAADASAGDDLDDGSDDTDGPTWYTDVKPLMESHCISCHQEGAVGSFSLDTPEAVAIVSEHVADAVQNRRMPPWKAVEGCDDYRDDISLSDDEIDMIVDWIDAGMPEGDISLAKSGEPPQAEGLERVDISLTLPVAYTPDTSQSDDYRCFPVEWPEEGDGYVTGFMVNPDQADMVHHVIAFIAEAAYAEDLLAEEAKDGLPGYSCFGGPGVISQVDASWLGAWAPGAIQGNFPNDVGIIMNAGDWVIIQVHYNNVTADSPADQTTIDFQVESEVDRMGWIQPFTDPAWVYGTGMEIPAGTEGVQHSFSFELAMSLDVHSANLHMHRLGKKAIMSMTKTDGTEDCLVAIDDWDFDWQRSYVFDEMKTTAPGDVWTIECEWDNPTDQDVAWGDGTGDEMCLGSLLMSIP